MCACVYRDGVQRVMSAAQPQLEVYETILSINSLEAADNLSFFFSQRETVELTSVSWKFIADLSQ